MNPILSSKSKQDIQVHEKTNLSIVSSTQDPGELIPVGLGFPASGSLIACMCCGHRTSVIIGGETEVDGPGDQPSSEDRKAEGQEGRKLYKPHCKQNSELMPEYECYLRTQMI